MFVIATPFLAGFATCTALRTLDLSSNSFGSSSGSVLGKLLATVWIQALSYSRAISCHCGNLCSFCNGFNVLTQHPVLTSLNIERIDLGENGARGLAAAVIRGLPLDGVSAYGMFGMIGALKSCCRFGPGISASYMELLVTLLH